jgi:formylglycine-generating enzyme required for sulfatase activity
VHVSGHEAFAYATWRGARLPTEFEWEHAIAQQPVTGSFVESACYHPNGLAAQDKTKIKQAYGEVWQWTSSSYGPYPGYQPLAGTLGEYNGKFMSGQLILRGGSCATPSEHIRPSYRNFFYPPDRWQFSGIRLAQ